MPGVLSRLNGAIAIALIGICLNFPYSGYVSGVDAQAAGSNPSPTGFRWEYQLDFNASSLTGARQQASSLAPGLNREGVATSLQALAGSSYRLTMSGDRSIDQVRQVLYSPQMAGFIGGAAEIEVTIPTGSVQDIAFKLESNPTTGSLWQVSLAGTTGFVQAGEATFVPRSKRYGTPSVQRLVLHPQNLEGGKVALVYRRPFGPVEAATRHLAITLAAAVTEIDLGNPARGVLSLQSPSSYLVIPKSPFEAIPLKGTLPAAMDWRTAGIVPAVRNQGYCGSCWAFGTVGVMESAIAKAGGPLTDLSEQFLVSCNTSGWNCEEGGLTAHLWHYNTMGINQNTIGAVLEADDPYIASDGSCSVQYKHPYKLSGWQFIVPNEWTMPTVDQIKYAIATYGPVTAGVCAGRAFDYYSGGIFSTDETANCQGADFLPFQTNHQIILVGWNDTGAYWILRNSWGSYWGEDGYMRIAYNTSHVGEGTSWVTWGYRIYMPSVMRVH